MRRISQGDHEAYRLVLERQLPSVSRYVIRMMGTSRESEDTIQEVFLRVWTHAGRFDSRVARLSTWLHNIAHNLCIDYFRKEARHVGTETGEEPAGESDPESAFIREHRNLAVKDALMAIPERQRSAVILCHYQGLSNKEAASVLGVSVDALESLLARGRRNLKEILTIDE